MGRRGHRWIASLFFLLLACTGWTILDDYGISWDEAIQRRHGRVSLDYAAAKLGIEHDKLEPKYDLEDYQWANYGMVYQLSASLLEQRLGIADDRFAYYRLRHRMDFGLFLIALGCFYAMLRLRWPARPWYPLLGTLMLTLSPRIFGHAFFNPKDHLLLVGYLVATFTLLRFLRQRSWSALLLHALATALALNTRLPALLIVAATVAVLVWEQATEKRGGVRNWLFAICYLLLSFAFMVPFFPYLWEDTLSRLGGAFSEMSGFDWGGYNLLFGDRLVPSDVPWYYVPAWILITTPLLYLPFLLSGVALACAATVRALRRGRLWSDFAAEFDFVQFGLSVGPVVVVVLLDSTLYNGWRHLHFVYPGLICLSLTGFTHWRVRYPVAAPAVLALGLTMAGVAMVRYHPHQYVYFNEAIQGKPLAARFDMDYWGVGYRQAFLELAEAVPEGEVRSVYCGDWPCRDNLLALPREARDRLKPAANFGSADFFATNYISQDVGAAERREGKFARPAVLLAPGGHLSIGIYRIIPTE